ncbi:hypothetical protein LK07_31540 [Streptomyces pluripotens]|uniref:Secreted protein n=2 Tax=Streptomyces TaxID=1883 RepID=A0A221P6Q9_9ACTN|nr:hypothetical protein LK06_030350 [Streptomyces pluripotens]ASN27804.1 hypothetical protein LK07_31540 [Streptomyces pluripotens]KIE26796.1 hypothetical protein LK08_11055 [Streptomyces sp. MUSC 125]MCH0557263.1 hypothetical protein [Streptomyces sp. MUM 16J]
MQLAAASGLMSLGLFLVALGLLVLLGGGYWLTSRVKYRESPRPRPEEQPHLPPEGAVYEVRENRESAEVPKTPEGGRPLTPYELTNMDTRPSESKDRPRWSKGSSGSFGGGGLGAH